jgi:hypothetical protein
MILNLDEFKNKYYYSNLESIFFKELEKVCDNRRLVQTINKQKRIEKLMNIYLIEGREEKNIRINPF